MFFRGVTHAAFVERPNRFIVHCRVGKRQVRAYMPNPGRLRELLLPDVKLWLVPNNGGATDWTVVAVERDGRPVMLHTHATNDVADRLLRDNRIPSLAGWDVVRREVRAGRSRFDFLLRRDGDDMYLEVKSCTLFGREIAMFPDAVTERGRRHVEELAAMAQQGMRVGVLFIVHSPLMSWFLPDYHTDPAFAATFCDARHDVPVTAAAVTWNDDLALGSEVRELEIPWAVVERENRDRGSYIITLQLDEDAQIATGGLDMVRYRKGFYCYVGSAMQGLSQRIARHRGARKRHHWHIDHLRARAAFVDALPIRASDRLECEIASAVARIAGWHLPQFGSSDCDCPSHLFGFSENPVRLRAFQDVVQYFRIDRLIQMVNG